MSSYRPERVGEQIHKEISRLLHNGIKDPRVNPVSITGVEMTRDLRLARVFFTVSNESAELRDARAGLKSAGAYIRREIGRAIRLRFVPELRFEYDRSLVYGERIDSLLRQVKDDFEHDPEDSATD